VARFVIDLGCGDHKQPGTVGIDVAALPGVDLLGDALALPLRDSAVDAVHASHVLEHFDDLVGVMEEIWRVCKPGARVYVTVPHASSSFQAWRDPTHRRGITLNTFTYFDKASPEGKRFSYYTRANFRGLFGRLRFTPGDYVSTEGRNRLGSALTACLETLANRSPRAQYLCERWWGGWFGIAEAYAELEAVK
jgi:SAM-dependent methyltransferase